MATSPATSTPGFLTPIKSRLANRLSGHFHKRSYNQFETSASVDEITSNSSKSDANPDFFGFSPTEIKSFSPPIVHNDYLFTKDNYVLFYVQFTRVEYGLFKDLISLTTPVQDIINRYSNFFHDSPKLKLFTGPKVGVSQKAKFGRTRSLSLTKASGTYHKLEPNINLFEQNINSSYLLIISPPSDAKFNKEMFQAYLNSKTEQTLFVERWIPAVQGSVPLNEDTACVVAACLYTLNSIQNTATSYNSSPRDFIHRGVPVTKLAETKIVKTLEELKPESVENIMKLCAEAVLSNFLSAAIILSVNTGSGIYNEHNTYFVLSSESIVLVKKSDLSRIISCVQLVDIKSWKHSGNTLNIEHVNRLEQTTVVSHLVVKSKDAALISTILTAVGHALAAEEH
ncbi:hypothetical protein LOD99_3509 [Oopsacas minuta]|uniref:Uncharacterized protein n=1 Tax=Oopsacas minuta TaxID=111878 RepID=A0AAV7JYP7_9METZ|nr:hypothetical protein LOD99_3509 [Oopsacas minuta]